MPHFKESTALILISVMFSILTIVAVIDSAPILACFALCFSSLVLLTLGFYNIANDN